MYLHSHVDALLQSIRKKALVNYTHPYSLLNLDNMAALFKTNVVGLESELAALVMEGQIQARIDSEKKVSILIYLFQRLIGDSSAVSVSYSC